MSSFLQARLMILAYVEQHIAEGQTHISKMQRLIADGQGQGFDMSEAKILLADFTTNQAGRHHHREQILTELDSCGPEALHAINVWLFKRWRQCMKEAEATTDAGRKETLQSIASLYTQLCLSGTSPAQPEALRRASSVRRQ